MEGMMNMGGSPPPPAATGIINGEHKMPLTHMTFYWGSRSEILIRGWPGSRRRMYVLALVVVFVMAVLVEWLSCCRITPKRWPRQLQGLVRTAMHAVRVGLAFVVMLALMSFNVGVLIAAIAGHTLGFMLFQSDLICINQEKKPNSWDSHVTDLPPIKC